jgi:hypothetical protein
MSGHGQQGRWLWSGLGSRSTPSATIKCGWVFELGAFEGDTARLGLEARSVLLRSLVASE